MEETITAWIARDKEGLDFWIGFGDNLVIDRHLFPQVKWENEEPTKVELTIKICK